MALLKFLKGNYASLNSAAITEGQILICNDTAEMFVDIAADKRIKIGDFTVVANIAALESLDATSVPTSRLYYVEDGNILARSNGITWVQVNKQPTADELKTLLGLGSAAYTDASAYDAAGSAEAVRTYVGEIPETAEATNIIAYIQEKTAGIATDTALEELTGRVAGAEKDIENIQGALEGKSDEGHKHVKADITDFEHTHVKADITDFEHTHVVADITDFDEKVKAYDYATKSEAQGYADAKDDAIAEAKQVGTDAAAALNTYKGEMTTALAGKQDVIPENTYDAHGAADQALTDAKAYVDEEDVFETDMATINALGGIAAGADLNGLTTHEVLKKLLYPYVDATVGNATATPNGGTYENGATKTITQVSISITKKSEPITSVALYNGSTLIEEKTGDAVKNGGTITFSNLSVEVPTNGNQLTVKVTYPDANGNAKTVEKKTTALTFVYPYYMGTCAAGTSIDETLVESLTKKIESKGNKSNSFTVSDGHMVFAYPKAHGVLKSILDPNNFETIGNYTRSEVSVTGLDGTAQTYYVYVSGATTVSGFVVNFKY